MSRRATNRRLNACLRRAALAGAVATAAWASTLTAPPSASAAVAIRDDPVFVVRLQDDSDIAVRCGPAGIVEVLVNGATQQPLTTPCAAITYIELNAAGSGSNVLDVTAVTRELFSSLPDRVGILLEAGTGDDTLLGSALGEFFTGNDGNDIVRAGAGDDNVSSGAGADSLDCGGGTDLLTYITDHTGVTVDLASAAPFTRGEAEGDRATGCENLRGGTGPDVLATTGGPYEVDGANGTDVLLGRPGNRLAGGPDVDTASFAGARTGLTADLARQSLSWSSGDFTLTGFENLVGSRYDDRLIGDTGPNKLTGGAGNDRIAGGAGADRLAGGAANDVLDGGPGRDRCTGGPGRNRLTSC
jgi:Ca2+-binding RTX toxin-like protein